MDRGKKSLFDSSSARANAWVRDFMDELRIGDVSLARRLLCATLIALRDRLPPDAVHILGRQLPLAIREAYLQGYDRQRRPLPTPDFVAFCRHLQSYTGDVQGLDGESILRALYKLLAVRIAVGAIDDIVDIMPPELNDMWRHRIRSYPSSGIRRPRRDFGSAGLPF